MRIRFPFRKITGYLLMSRKTQQAENEAYRDHLQQLQTELRQTQAKLQAASHRGKADVLQALLPILADMRRALQHADQDADPVRKGVEMIWKKFEEFIRGQGLKLIPTVGERFDPARHEAMSTEPATPEYPPDTIVSEIRAGYFLEGELLATAQVVVARAAEIDTSEKEAGARQIAVRDVTSHSLGIGTYGGVMTKLIERNTPLPACASYILPATADNQPSIEIHVLQGEHERVQDNHTLGRFHFEGIPGTRHQIEVTLCIDSDGLVSGKAEDLGTGKELDLTIT